MKLFVSVDYFAKEFIFRECQDRLSNRSFYNKQLWCLKQIVKLFKGLSKIKLAVIEIVTKELSEDDSIKKGLLFIY